MEQIRETILERIRDGEIKMHSRAYFRFRSALGLLLLMFMLVVTVMLVTFGFYVLKINGLLSLSQFGLKGMRDFILSLPWVLFLITVAFMVTAAVFMKQYPMTYRRPLVYSVAALLLVFSGGTVLFVAMPSVRRGVYYAAETTEVPVITGWYDSYARMGARNAVLGRVVTADAGLEIATREGERMLVATGRQTAIYTRDQIEAGDYVLVHGRRNGRVIGAFAIEEIYSE